MPRTARIAVPPLPPAFPPPPTEDLAEHVAQGGAVFLSKPPELAEHEAALDRGDDRLEHERPYPRNVGPLMAPWRISFPAALIGGFANECTALPTPEQEFRAVGLAQSVREQCVAPEIRSGRNRRANVGLGGQHG